MLITRRRAISPYDNAISILDMERLLEAAGHAGVDLDSPRIRTKEDRNYKRRSVAASLGEALSSSEGWYIYPDEAAELARRLPNVAWGSPDPTFIRQMARFFAMAAKYGGLFVF